MTMPILDIQKRARELGRIRIGQTVPTSNGKKRPEKLDRFRLTSSSKVLLEKVAELYGGEVKEWEPQGGGPKAWEVITTSTRLPIMVPPQPVTQWYEYWTRGGCAHRCDGYTNWSTGEPCDLEDDDHLEALKKPTTRLNVVLRDVEGIGVWRLETHGWNAAVELPQAAEFLAAAGGYVEGWVSLEERVSISDGKTKRFMVPIIEIDVTPAELMAGRGAIRPPELEGPAPAKAIGTGAPDEQPAAPTLTDEQLFAMSLDELKSAWGKYEDEATRARIKARAEAVKAQQSDTWHEPAPDEPQPDEEGVYDAQVVEDDDADLVWGQCLKVAGELGATLPQVTADFEQRYAMNPGQASASELRVYLEVLKSEGIEAAA